MAERSTAFFGLRTNAHALVAGAPARSVERRLKLAAVLHDEVLIEAGRWTIQAGEHASNHWQEYESGYPFQSSGERRRNQAGGFILSIGTQDVPGIPAATMQPFAQTKTTIAWRATFDPIVQQLPRTYPWIDRVIVQSDSQIKDAAHRWERSNSRASELDAAFPDKMTRDVVARSAMRDLLAGTGDGAVVCTDALHGRVLAALGDKVIDGRRSLDVLYPNIAELRWDEVDEIRNDRGIRSLRSLLRDIEAAASVSGAFVGDAATRRLADELAQANARTSLRGRVARGGLSLAFGEILGLAATAAAGAPVPVVGSAAAAVAQGTAKMIRQRRHWVGTHALIRSKRQDVERRGADSTLTSRPTSPRHAGCIS